MLRLCLSSTAHPRLLSFSLRKRRLSSSPTTPSSASAAAADVYERKTPHEHVLLRPGMYLGQMEPIVSDTWLYNEEKRQMVKKSIYYSPALLKVCLC